MNKLTFEQQEDKKARYKLNEISNRVRSNFSFGKIKTFADLLNFVGISPEPYFPSELNKVLTYQDIKEWLSDRTIELETSIWLRKNPPIITYESEEKINIEVTTSCNNILESNNKDSSNENSKDILPTIPEHEKDYGFKRPEGIPSTTFFTWFQKKEIADSLDKIINKKHRGRLIISATGSGKTWIAGAVLKELLNRQYHVGKTFTPWPYVFITKAPAVENTKRKLKKYFNIDPENEVLVINIEQLRSEFGKRFVKEDIKIVQGEEEIHWKWRPNIFPIVILGDEIQVVKNTWSQQSKIFQSYLDIPSPHTCLISMSATPFTKVSEAKVIAVSTRVPYKFGIGQSMPLTNDHWLAFSEDIASNWGKSDTKPDERSPAAVDRLVEYIKDYVGWVKGIKYQFHANNRVNIIQFETKEDEKFYNDAWERFLQKKAKLEASEGLSKAEVRMNMLAALTIFRIAAESCPGRVKRLAREMYHAVQEGRAAVCSVNFKITICKIVEILVKEYKVPRHMISLIWGGAPKPKKKAILKANIINNQAMLDMLSSKGISLKDLDLDEIEAAEEDKWLSPELKLGAQSQKQRQEEIDRFQSGKALYALYTFRAGGVALDLHHCDDYTTQKVRHKESGYAYEEDIPNIPTRPRINFVAPTYSPIELVQGLGRCARLTSLSHTEQIMMFYAGTIEEDVAAIVSLGLRCLTKVVRNRESWEDMIVGKQAEEKRKEFKDTYEKEPEEDEDVLPSTEEEDDE